MVTLVSNFICILMNIKNNYLKRVKKGEKMEKIKADNLLVSYAANHHRGKLP